MISAADIGKTISVIKENVVRGVKTFAKGNFNVDDRLWVRYTTHVIDVSGSNNPTLKKFHVDSVGVVNYHPVTGKYDVRIIESDFYEDGPCYKSTRRQVIKRKTTTLWLKINNFHSIISSNSFISLIS